MASTQRASIEFSIGWQSLSAIHVDRHLALKVDFGLDTFPGEIKGQLAALRVGERCGERFGPGVLVPPFEKDRIVRFRAERFEGNRRGLPVAPRLGRFYPRGIAWRALDCFPQNLLPFRIVHMQAGVITADLNHPLSRYPVTFEAKMAALLDPPRKQGGSVNDMAAMTCSDGPGMQAPYPGVPTDFFSDYPLPRTNDGDDRLFYKSPRLVHHLDETAISHIEGIYARLLPKAGRILDLMGSWASHIPGSLTGCRVTGLGLNSEELAANRQLTDFVVHDLNRSPSLPFDDDAFDAVICTASIEYLARPLEVIVEVSRILRPGGVFITTFSDRWFPGKQILSWSEMHPFERLGFVLACYMTSNAFEALHTESIRGYPRPVDDKYIGERATSDPVFGVWGSVKKNRS